MLHNYAVTIPLSAKPESEGDIFDVFLDADFVKITLILKNFSRHFPEIESPKGIDTKTDHESIKYLDTREFLILRLVRWLESIFQFIFYIVPMKRSIGAATHIILRESSRTNEPQE